MSRRDEVEGILSVEPTTTDDAIKLIRAIDSIYRDIDKDASRLVKPHYEAIEQIHDQSSAVSKGLWEKRKSTEEKLMALAKEKKAP